MLDHVSDIPVAGRFDGAFVRDPDGNRVEAVCHLAP